LRYAAGADGNAIGTARRSAVFHLAGLRAYALAFALLAAFPCLQAQWHMAGFHASTVAGAASELLKKRTDLPVSPERVSRTGTK